MSEYKITGMELELLRAKASLWDMSQQLVALTQENTRLRLHIEQQETTNRKPAQQLIVGEAGDAAIEEQQRAEVEARGK